MEPVTSSFVALRQLLRQDKPLSDMTLYVSPSRSCAQEITDEVIQARGTRPKFLLVGARGGGKSTELRAIGSKLSGKATTASIDLDASGINATSVSAFDLLYLSSLGFLSHIHDEDLKVRLFSDLAKAYAPDNQSHELGTVRDALSGIATFAETAGKAALAVGLLAGGVPAIAAAGTAVAAGLKLLHQNRQTIVAESSPKGRALQSVADGIAAKVWQIRGQLPLCSLIDGLEKINGESGERFRAVFEETRLIADAPWSYVIAAPPVTLTETNAARARGYVPKVVWGFDKSDDGKIVEVLSRRFNACHLDPDTHAEAGTLKRIAIQSGGLPRDAIGICNRAVRLVIAEESTVLKGRHVESGLREEAETLALGLTEQTLLVLARVMKNGLLPSSEEAATLFADGRILAHPPEGNDPSPRFCVHPLLVPAVDAFVAKGTRNDGSKDLASK